MSNLQHEMCTHPIRTLVFGVDAKNSSINTTGLGGRESPSFHSLFQKQNHNQSATW